MTYPVGTVSIDPTFESSARAFIQLGTDIGLFGRKRETSPNPTTRRLKTTIRDRTRSDVDPKRVGRSNRIPRDYVIHVFSSKPGTKKKLEEKIKKKFGL